MKKAIAMKWVKALRSGKYRQTSSVLYDGGAFCCLGVLCDISKKRKWHKADDSSYRYGRAGTTVLPAYVRDWAGMLSASGTSSIIDRSHQNGGHHDLISMNDRKGWSFKKIARWIERHYESL